jgi:GNAT superfamily N-acetyltransferase
MADFSPTLRLATEYDVDTIVELLIAVKEQSLAALITDHDRNAPFWRERWRRYIVEGSSAQYARGDGWAFLAEVDGWPIGFAAYHHTARHGADAELQAIYVLHEMQGLGVGSQLLRRIARRLVADGSRTMCVGYDPRNPYKWFYARHGAVEIDPHWSIWRDLGRLAAGDEDGA